MPELPIAAVYSANLASMLSGKEVESIELNRAPLNVSCAELQAAVIGTVLSDVKRSGKEILFQFSNSSELLVHLLLAEGFAITRTPGDVQFKSLLIAFKGGPSLIISDPKGEIRAQLNPPPPAAPYVLDINLEYLRGKIAKKTKMLAKAFLIDQSLFRGIGNAYADEILWEARISPKSVMGKIPDEAIELLFNSMRKVLIDAVDEIGKAKPDIISGQVLEILKVHNHSRAQSPTGWPIKKESVAGKTTYYTDEQALYI